MSSPSLQIADTLLAASSAALRRATQFLLSRQAGEGYWCGELTADTTLESDFILLELWRHAPENGAWNPPTRALIDKAARSILARQLPDGGFSIYEQGPSEVSASIKAYTALRLAGLGMDDANLSRLRERILALGGLQAANSYVKINLSLFGLFPREHTPSIPPELNLFGNVIYEMSSWTRAIVTPLSILHSMNPQRPVPAGFTVNELMAPGVSLEFAGHNEKLLSWGTFFFVADRFLKLWERHGSRSLRMRAIRRAEQWILERTRHADGLGAIYPSMMYVVMALDCLGYPADHPDVQEANHQFMNLMIDDHRGFFFQPCFSPVWDTAIAVHALGEAGCAPESKLTASANWLLSKEVRRKGDWSVKRPNVEPSGWYFEFANEWYPDIDDTAQVLLALAQSSATDSEAQKATRKRAVDWLLAMQGSDGGWAAFDVDNNWNFLSSVPFADHNAMLDPTCPDITGRVLEALAACGVPNSDPAVRRGVAYLKRSQEADGSWYGRWGVDYIYGTYLALRGLRASGESDREAFILRAGEWLRSIQNADGGWGESCASYDQGTFVSAHSTPSQTAWAVLGLIAGGDTTSGSVHKGAEYLIETQREDGGWDEDLSTGTGFPGVFYLQYHLYRHSFPVLALAGLPESKRSNAFMRFPISQAASMATYIAKNKLRPRPEWQKNLGTTEDLKNPFRIVHAQIPSARVDRKPHPMLSKRFPLVMMLEPLHACNLTCTGCGRIREYETSISSRLTLEQCLKAVDECGAPMVSICGGEPFLYPELPQLCQEILKRGKYIQLCTNGMFIAKRLKEFTPDPGLVLNVHLDGMEKNHDLAVEREGVFKAAIEGIRIAKQNGFKVFTNTTVYRETDMNEIDELYTFLAQYKVDGHTISPAYGYSSVNDQEIFMTREDIYEKFKDIDKMAKKFPLVSSPVYMDFLKGDRDLPCTAWGNPTYNVKGWKGPCYLITDAHHETFEELMTKTPWENYGSGNDPRCDQCMVHCGYEPSSAYGINAKLSDPFKTLSWLLG